MTNKTFLFVEKLTYKDTSLLKTYFLQEFSFVNLSRFIDNSEIPGKNKLQTSFD